MKQQDFNDEFDKMFSWFTNESQFGLPKKKLNFYEKLWNLVLIGPSYYFIMNHHNSLLDFVSEEVEEVTGYTPFEFSIQLMNDNLHPDDRSWFISNGYKTIEFFSGLSIEKLMKYKLRYDIRYKKKNGDYARILYQGVMLEHDDSGRPSRSLVLHTDITYLKQEGRPILSFIGLDGEPSFVDVGAQNIYVESKDELTGREKEVLALLIQGKLSKEISSILNISKQTVDTHRKNMLHKKNLSTTGELIGKAIQYGWI